MHTILLSLQILVALVFLFSGINKSYFSEKTLVEKGQTGVEGLPLPLIRFIGISEILGAFGLVLPTIFQKSQWLVSFSALGFCIIMLLAARIHYRRGEHKNVVINFIIFVICGFIASQRGQF